MGCSSWGGGVVQMGGGGAACPDRFRGQGCGVPGWVRSHITTGPQACQGAGGPPQCGGGLPCVTEASGFVSVNGLFEIQQVRKRGR